MGSTLERGVKSTQQKGCSSLQIGEKYKTVVALKLLMKNVGQRLAQSATLLQSYEHTAMIYYMQYFNVICFTLIFESIKSTH